MFGLEITILKLLMKMYLVESLNLGGIFYIAVERHIGSFYLSNCEMKSQQSQD